MFDDENDSIDYLADELDPLNIYDLDGDGKTSFEEELIASDIWDDSDENSLGDDLWDF